VIRLSCSGALAVLVVALSTPLKAHGQEEGDPPIVTEPPLLPEPVVAEPGVPETQSPLPADPPPTPVPSKSKPGQLRVAAGIGLGFGGDLITVGISPQVSYIFKRIVEPGVSVRYQYTNDRFVIPNASWHTFGTSLFVRLYPIPSLFFLVEGELINTGFRQGDFQSGRANYGNLFLGGGYVMGVGRGVFIAVSLKVNVLRNDFYPTNIPIFGVGAGFAF
jgi:hypothetical protein